MVSLCRLRVLSVSLLVLSALAAASAGGVPSCPCPSGFSAAGTDGCYYLVPDGSYQAVQVACTSRGGKIISIIDERTNDLSRSIMTLHQRAMVWIGLFDQGEISKPDWRWSNDMPLGYTDWHREPGSGSCVAHWLHGGWQRRDCTLPAPGLCYKDRSQSTCPTPPPSLKARLLKVLGIQTVPADRPADQQLVPPPPPPLRTRPPLGPQTMWTQRKMPLRDAPITWYEWL